MSPRSLAPLMTCLQDHDYPFPHNSTTEVTTSSLSSIISLKAKLKKKTRRSKFEQKLESADSVAPINNAQEFTATVRIVYAR